MDTDILQVFSIYFYDLLYPGATLSFLTPLVVKKFMFYPIFWINNFWLQHEWVTLLWLEESLGVFVYPLPIELLG